jgi:uncharacterized membrane protein
MSWKRPALRFLIFALIGLLIEVFFTATFSLIGGNPNMRGSTSPWMMIDYGLLGVLLMPVATPLIKKGVPLFVRAAVYMIGIFVIEYFSGLIFVAFGLEIWNYDDKPLNLHGQITLTYAPFWYALGLVVEWLHRRVDAIAVLLLKGIKAEELEAL